MLSVLHDVLFPLSGWNIEVQKISSLLFVLAFFPAAVFATDPSTARVVTYKSNVAKCLAPVAIKAIDGKWRQLPALGFDLDPGEHSLQGFATAELTNCPTVKKRSRKPDYAPYLDWFFEPGKVYYVALDQSSPHRENWRLVVWKVESMDGELIFDISKKGQNQID